LTRRGQVVLNHVLRVPEALELPQPFKIRPHAHAFARPGDACSGATYDQLAQLIIGCPCGAITAGYRSEIVQITHKTAHPAVVGLIALYVPFGVTALVAGDVVVDQPSQPTAVGLRQEAPVEELVEAVAHFHPVWVVPPLWSQLHDIELHRKTAQGEEAIKRL